MDQHQSSDISCFLLHPTNEIPSLMKATEILRSLTYRVKNNIQMNNDEHDRACQFMQNLRPNGRFKFSIDQLLNHPTNNQNTGDYNILTYLLALISPNFVKLSTESIILLDRILFLTNSVHRVNIARSGFIHTLFACAQSFLMSFIHSSIHTTVLRIINYFISLPRQTNVYSNPLFNINGYSLTIELVLDHVITPCFPYFQHIYSNRYSLSQDTSLGFLRAISSILDLSYEYEVISQAIKSFQMQVIRMSMFYSFEQEQLFQLIIHDILRELDFLVKEDCSSSPAMSETDRRCLREEALSDIIEQRLISGCYHQNEKAIIMRCSLLAFHFGANFGSTTRL
ncbi:hypothetical protein BLNAU_11590 [Blattamonas nauphoetae]|uniref:Uncharacterized protein n=1 Tax=Blattamonas nauphoetae TaxID=2049346 RepID=A0ABQ9XS90_9EUKA|nr:hypothetical protein BLNAU_11590 [Blattamonas nauphoetae]